MLPQKTTPTNILSLYLRQWPLGRNDVVGPPIFVHQTCVRLDPGPLIVFGEQPEHHHATLSGLNH